MYSTPTPRRAVITGEVRSFQQRTEVHRPSAFAWNPLVPKTTIVWAFRVEQHDQSGNRLATIPIEMSGRSFEGALADGDQVEVAGPWQPGQTLRIRELRNLTTGAMVRSKKG